MSETAPGDAGSDGQEEISTGEGGPSCTAELVNIGNASVGWAREGLDQHPDSLPWFVQCDSGYTGIAWVPDDVAGDPVIEVVAGDPPTDPATLAASLLDSIPVPPVTLEASPDVGLVAVPTWYWVEGYDGEPLRGSRTLEGTTVEVEIAPAEYRWDFGDGASVTAETTGQPYPAESEIQHTYERASPDQGYDLALEIRFAARYRVDGGAWLELDPVRESYSRSYPVQQLQAVLTGE